MRANEFDAVHVSGIESSKGEEIVEDLHGFGKFQRQDEESQNVWRASEAATGTKVISPSATQVHGYSMLLNCV